MSPIPLVSRSATPVAAPFPKVPKMMATPRAVLLATALFAVPCQAQTNFLTNPGFESGLTGWSSFGAAGAQTSYPPQFTPNTGSGLASLTGQGGAFNVSGIFQTFPANPGDQFTIDAYSRHWGSDPLTGYGAPNDNWVVMKMAFFDAGGVEIGGAEATILDGTFPTDIWIDNAPVMGTAPAGTVTVQAFILFLQPQAGLGTALVDDLFFTGPMNNAPFPGTGDDLLLTTGVGGAAPTGGNGNYTKTANGGDLIEVNVQTPGGAFSLKPYFLLGQAFPTGSPLTPTVPSVYFNLTLPVIILVNGGVGGPFGPPVIGPLTGASSFYVAPPGQTGVSLMLQALVADPAAANGTFATSDGYVIDFN